MAVLSPSRMRLTLAVFTLAACTEATAPARRFPVLTDDGHGDWSSVSVGGDHTCALKIDRTAYCWGSGRDGHLGTMDAVTVCGGANK